METKPFTPNLLEVRKLADFLVRYHLHRPDAICWDISEIIGTVIDLKPTTMLSYDLTPHQLRTFQDLLANLQIFLVSEELPIPSSGNRKPYIFFISKDRQLAEELCIARRALIDRGWQANEPEDQKRNFRIGQLLGYPKTAINHYSFGPKDQRGIAEHRPGYEHDRYYIHSPLHFKTEYEEFEDILHAAVTKYCPQIARAMQRNQNKYWTSADLPKSP